ncbi:hypothetical protein STEG23_001787, partial [Scotinomys teguina]
MQSNWLTKIEGLQSLVNLRELYLSHNGIEVIGDLENNNKLTMLDMASNGIKKIETNSHLIKLQEFWMNDNLLESWSDLDQLKGARNLKTVYLERQPLEKDPQYRRKVVFDNDEFYKCYLCGQTNAMLMWTFDKCSPNHHYFVHCTHSDIYVNYVKLTLHFMDNCVAQM